MSHSQLELARSLTLPSRESMLQRSHETEAFWNTNRHLLVDAWMEWEAANSDSLLTLDDSVFDRQLHEAVSNAWQDPSTEAMVKNLLTEVSSGVFQFTLFDPSGLEDLRAFLEHVSSAKIPLRPPYGIALNRFGAMLDSRSVGHLAAPSFQRFYQEVLDKYMRPIARLLFPEIMGYDAQTFGFSIQYQPGMDTSLRLHTDASAVTLNVNINLPGEEFSGSEVDFYDPINGQVSRLSFEPGTAMIHRGNVPHAAQPILTGSRSNLVFWLYGNQGQLPRFDARSEAVSANQRWQVPQVKRDEFAPF